ncbi:MAG: BNR/Asp-box repeat protein [Smithella sp. PtaU1.Bin162]|nr:MAG: BNR/Asp-box repeat protein [Smithella sp. PtaU1.Bin162]
MKFIDFSSDQSRRVVVDKEKGQYLGHPTTVMLADQRTIYAVYPKGHAIGELVLKRSDDGGLTWSERLPTPENWRTSISCPTIHRLIDRQGKSRLIILSGNEGNLTVPVRQAISEDEGKNWTPLTPIGAPGYSSVVTGSSMIRLKNGDYMALQHYEYGNNEKLDLYKMITSNGGLDWSEPEQITNFPEAKLCEPGGLRSPDGNQIAVIIRDNSRRHNSMVIFSDNEGSTWSAPRELPDELTGDRHVARYAPDGRLFITFRDILTNSPTCGDWVAWVGTYQDILEGRPGQYRIRLMVNDGNPERRWDCGYPGLEILPDGTFVTTSYGHWEKGVPPYIVTIRLKIEELDVQ